MHFNTMQYNIIYSDIMHFNTLYSNITYSYIIYSNKMNPNNSREKDQEQDFTDHLKNYLYQAIPLQDPNMVFIFTVRKTGQTST